MCYDPGETTDDDEDSGGRALRDEVLESMLSHLVKTLWREVSPPLPRLFCYILPHDVVYKFLDLRRLLEQPERNTSTNLLLTNYAL